MSQAHANQGQKTNFRWTTERQLYAVTEPCYQFLICMQVLFEELMVLVFDAEQNDTCMQEFCHVEHVDQIRLNKCTTANQLSYCRNDLECSSTVIASMVLRLFTKTSQAINIREHFLRSWLCCKKKPSGVHYATLWAELPAKHNVQNLDVAVIFGMSQNLWAVRFETESLGSFYCTQF